MSAVTGKNLTWKDYTYHKIVSMFISGICWGIDGISKSIKTIKTVTTVAPMSSKGIIVQVGKCLAKSAVK
jgi:hypothetical protein